MPPQCRRLRSIFRRLNASKCLPFHLKINRRVSISRVDAGMSQPVANRDQIHPCLQEMNGGAVPHAVRMESFTGQCGVNNFCAFTVLGENVTDTETCQQSSTLVKKNRRVRAKINFSFGTEITQYLGSLRPERANPYFLSLTV